MNLKSTHSFFLFFSVFVTAFCAYATVDNFTHHAPIIGAVMLVLTLLDGYMTVKSFQLYRRLYKTRQ